MTHKLGRPTCQRLRDGGVGRQSEAEAERIGNGWILHYTRQNSADARDGKPRFGWVRLVDPAGEGGNGGREIKRPAFTNDEVAAKAEREGTHFDHG